MKVKDIASALEEFAPLSVQEGWDNSGLSIGSPEDEVSGVLVGFDCTPELIDEAIENDCNLVVTHHPLIFGGLKQIRPEDPVGCAVIKAIRGGIAVYSAHTTADKVRGGVSWEFAERLGLKDLRILDPEEGDTGLGIIGRFPEAKEPGEIVSLLKSVFGVSVVRASRPVEGLVQDVAFCGGSGSSLIGAAMKAGAQLYISADISYHHFFTPEGFMIMDIGHFESEAHIAGTFVEELRKKFPTFAVRLSEKLEHGNPIYYY